jgi:hypothetical protein
VTGAERAPLGASDAPGVAGAASRADAERPLVRGLRAGAAAALLGLPTVLAFFSGGVFDEPRLWAAFAVWDLVIVAALVGRLPRSAGAGAALAGLALLASVVALSSSWAPLTGPALADAQRLGLYVGAFAAGLLLLGGEATRRRVEPALAAGIVVVMAYALSGRLVPWLVDQAVGEAAAGRLEQPLTYWNALGALAAIGLVLVARLAAVRPWVTAAGPLLVTGLVLTFSRGALAAAVLGLGVLAWVAPTRTQVRAIAIVVGTGAVPALLAALALTAVRTAEGARDRDGAILLVVLLAASAAAAVLASRAAPSSQEPPYVRRRAAFAIPALLGLVAVAVALGSDRGPAASGPTAERFASVQSNRFDYWEVAAGTFAAHPVTGAGSGSFAVEWRRERDLEEKADDAHSLYLETAAELGLLGLAALALFAGSVALAARRIAPAMPGAVAALAAFGFHAGIDWDWEMPALSLVALLLAATVCAAARPRGPAA